MANSNNKISHTIASSVPFFVRNDHQKFVSFMEAYYEWMETDSGVVNRLKTHQQNMDIDTTIDEFADNLYETFLKFIPENILADRKLLLKNVKDFYRARGTEKSARFLMRILFDEDISFYYPRQDVLRVSDGKWFIQKSLRISGVTLNSIVDPSFTTLNKFISTRITGLTSGAEALVERVDRFYEQGTLVDELIISNVDGNFQNGEDIRAYFDDTETTSELRATTFGGIINSIEIINGGTNYEFGDPVVILSNTGSGAIATVAAVTTGNLSSISVVEGGAGYQNGNFLLITGGGGSGANANVLSVNTDATVHPNSYNIAYSTIALEANTPLNNAIYSNLIAANANTTLINSLGFWSYSNTGPARIITVRSAGSLYSSPPAMSIIANTQIQQLGILGRLRIVNGGTNYRIGDQIEFLNNYGTYGAGALANVTNVGVSNTITEVRFVEMPGHIVGGSGYDLNNLPLANVRSSTGTGANVMATALLGTGAQLVAANSSIGIIQRITITNRGSGYEDATIDMTGHGDGNANLEPSVLQGVFEYPGRFLNDDGFISSYNFIQDRDYYQNFSYVIKTQQSIDKYRQAMKELTHPAGTKMFGECVRVNEEYIQISNTRTANSELSIIFKKKTYEKVGNTINIVYASHGLSNAETIYLEYQSGDFNNVRNGIYLTTNVTTNFIRANQSYFSGNTSGNVYVGIARV